MKQGYVENNIIGGKSIESKGIAITGCEMC